MKRTRSNIRLTSQEVTSRATKKQRVNNLQKVQGPQRKRKREESYTPPRTPTKRIDALTTCNAGVLQSGPRTPESQIKTLTRERIWNSIHSNKNSVLQTPIKSPSFSNDRIRMTCKRALKFGDDQLEKTPCSKDFSLFQTLNVNSVKISQSRCKITRNNNNSSQNQNRLEFLRNNSVENDFMYGKQQMDIIEEGEEEEISQGEKQDPSFKNVKMLGKCVENQISKSLEVLNKPFQQFSRKSHEQLGLSIQQMLPNKQIVYHSSQNNSLENINQGDAIKNVHVQSVVKNNTINQRRQSIGELFNSPANSKYTDFLGQQKMQKDDATARIARRYSMQNNSSDRRKSTEIVKYQQNSMLSIPQQIHQEAQHNNNNNKQQQFSQISSRNFFPQGGSENYQKQDYPSTCIYNQFSYQNNSIFSHGFSKLNYENDNNNSNCIKTANNQGAQGYSQGFPCTINNDNHGNNQGQNQGFDIDEIQTHENQNYQGISNSNLVVQSNFGNKNYNQPVQSNCGSQNLNQAMQSNCGSQGLDFGTSSNFGTPQKNIGTSESMDEARLGVDVQSSCEKKNNRGELFTPDRLKIASMDSARDVAKFIRSRRIMFDSYAFNDTSDTENKN